MQWDELFCRVYSSIGNTRATLTGAYLVHLVEIDGLTVEDCF